MESLDDALSTGSPATTAPLAGPPADSRAPAPDGGSPPAPGRLAMLVLAAGIGAGIVAWLAGEASLNAFVPPLHDVNVMGTTLKKVDPNDQSAADYKNALVAFGWLGGLLAAGMGLAGGLARNCAPRPCAAAIGLVVGVGAALVASAAFLPIYFRRARHGQRAAVARPHDPAVGARGDLVGLRVGRRDRAGGRAGRRLAADRQGRARRPGRRRHRDCGL